ncbi:helix-turn-helix domain-containing protein [Selenomonas sp. ND2010]|uniref:helix-turn-helix domain-containing protein n=1 Tax=Selenomonas sp. ND2010 TaxID=1410618 RepID=UPI0018CBF97C
MLKCNSSRNLSIKRKANALTQKNISERSGLSQQVISRLEKGNGGTIETIIRYLSARGYSLTLKES